MHEGNWEIMDAGFTTNCFAVEEKGDKILTALQLIWLELLAYCKHNATDSVGKNVALPSFLWHSSSSVKMLQAYPTGISKVVLLTELEAKW